MQGTTPPGSVQLQDYYIRPEKMGAPRKDLADAILSYNGNDSQKNGEPFFQSLSAFASDPRRRAVAPVNTYTALSSRWRGLSASDVLAPLLTPLTLWRNPPRRTGNRRTGCGITFQSNCHSPCAGLSPAFPMTGNRNAHQKGGSSADIPHRNLAPLAHGMVIQGQLLTNPSASPKAPHTVMPGRLKMEVYAASRRDLANAIQSYNDNDSITSSSNRLHWS